MKQPSKAAIAIAADDHQRSEFVRSLVQGAEVPLQSMPEQATATPKTILQFWDDLDRLPRDVEICLESWDQLEARGYERRLFDDRRARAFIADRFGSQLANAYERCYHPAMKSDYFRLCYIVSEGGCYVDADDKFSGADLEHLFSDGRLKLQPLCYDVNTGSMVEPAVFTKQDELLENCIFYFNNNPILAAPADRVLEYALDRATRILIDEASDEFPEIQSTTGPGNLTASLVAHAATNAAHVRDEFMILTDWESYARTVWPLSYRCDTRNWRLSNGQRFTRES